MEYWVVGGVFAVMLVLLCLAVAYDTKKAEKQEQDGEKQYDERQLALRDKAMAHAYLAVIVCLLLDYALSTRTGRANTRHGLDGLAGIWGGMACYNAECILRGAFLPFRSNGKGYAAFYSAIALTFAVIFGRDILESYLMGGGLPANFLLTLGMACYFILPALAFGIRFLLDRRAEKKGEPEAKNPRLKAARTAKGLSRQQLADLVGVSRRTIDAIEAGGYDPTVGLCLAICKALDKTPDELFGE